jgi:hypothetical protein
MAYMRVKSSSLSRLPRQLNGKDGLGWEYFSFSNSDSDFAVEIGDQAPD